MKDVAVPLRDGAIIYIDIYLPKGASDVPVIVSWSPYGKGNTDGFYDALRWLFGVKESEDAHDLVEWLGVQPWCNGNVGLAGDSWLAASQWFTAAEQPPHLKAIAPWEGFSDMYRDLTCVGGIPDYSFMGPVSHNLIGHNNTEDIATFDMEIDEDMTLIGYPTVSLWVEAKDADDMDLFLILQKLDEDGRPLTVTNPPSSCASPQDHQREALDRCPLPRSARTLPRIPSQVRIRCR